MQSGVHSIWCADQIGDFKEADFIEADNESHCAGLHSELFCVIVL